MGNYRQHHTICSPRFDQSFTGACEQQSIETVVLQKRFLENKAKKAAKKTDKKQLENTGQASNLQSSIQVVSSLLKLNPFLLGWLPRGPCSTTVTFGTEEMRAQRLLVLFRALYANPIRFHQHSNKNSWSGPWTIQTMPATAMSRHPSFRTQTAIWSFPLKLCSNWSSQRQRPTRSHNKLAQMLQWRRWRIHRSKVIVVNMAMATPALYYPTEQAIMTVAAYQIYTANQTIRRHRKHKTCPTW